MKEPSTNTTAPAIEQAAQQRRRLPWIVFWLLCGLYLLTMSGHTYSADEETMLAVSRALLRGEVAVTAPVGAPLAALRPGLDGQRYSPYGILPSLLAIPAFGLVLPALSLGPAAFEYSSRLAVTLLNVPITAATAAVLTAWSLRLGANRGGAFAIALLYSLATFAWPYARTFFSEPLAALLLLLAAERLDALRSNSERPQRTLFVAGLAAGLLVATRVASGIALPLLGCYLLWLSWRARKCHWPLAWGLGLLPGFVLIGWYNLVRFGTPLASGYGSEADLFTTPLFYGLYGLLLSPGKSLFLYAPPLVLGFAGAFRLARKHTPLLLLIYGLVLAHILLYARWGEWAGGGVWGPRFLLPIVALLLLPAAGLWLNSERRHPLRVAAVLLLSGLGFVANLGGVWLNFNTYLNMPLEVDRINSWRDSALPAHWRIIGERIGNYSYGGSHCALADGFFPVEGPMEERLPRRSGAVGSISCRLESMGVLRLWIDDRRPADAPDSELTLRLDGATIAQPPAHQSRAYTIALPPGRSRVQIAAVPWNPQAIGFSERNDELGPLISTAQLQSLVGTEWPLIDRAIAPLPEPAAPRWAWYFDPPNQHLVDHWAWYLPRSELAGPPGWLLAALLLAAGGACLGAAWQLARN
jgi:hypothetical protein